MSQALEIAQSHAERVRKERRERCPFTTARVDDLREHLGDGVRVRYVNENGYVDGKPWPRIPERTVNASEWSYEQVFVGPLEFVINKAGNLVLRRRMPGGRKRA